MFSRKLRRKNKILKGELKYYNLARFAREKILHPVEKLGALNSLDEIQKLCCDVYYD